MSQRKIQVLKQFTGLKNIVPPDRFVLGDLQEAVNVDIDNTGKVLRRGGYAPIPGNTDSSHSLFMQTGMALYRSGTELRRLYPQGNCDVVRNDMTVGLRTWYVMVNGKIYYSDGASTGVIDGGVNRSWGLAVPTTLGSLTTTTGNLKKGRYTICQTYVRSDGQESAPSEHFQINTGDDAGINISYVKSADPDVFSINIYMTAKNGVVFFLVTQLGNADGIFTYQGDTTEFYQDMSDIIQDSGPPIPCNLIEHWKGRIYAARFGLLFYSQPFSYELFNYSSDYLPFPKDITLLAATVNGLFVGTTENIYYLQETGDVLSLTLLTDYGAVYGTQVKADISFIGDGSMSGVGVVFLSSKGVCVGYDGGQLKNLTHDTYSFGSAIEGTGAIVQRHGMYNYVFTTHDTTAKDLNRYDRPAYLVSNTSELNMSFIESNNQIPSFKGVN